MNLAPEDFAIALARRVLPVPGGPNNKTPLIECLDKMPSEKYAGLSNGRVTNVCNISLVELGRIRSLKPTVMLEGFMTVVITLFSYVFSSERGIFADLRIS